ncbi:MAG TPA: hypothetical protein DCW68_01610 [Rhodospirillaceae bacterium]|nr:MAG: hypothetical protein A2018_04575 [Alphaproteobacteria bacterium GWF2_58_20]HAU28794.1 hypothetical protein [Rhodospirillaceae bacterium]
MRGNAKLGKMVFILSDQISSSLSEKETMLILIGYCAHCVCNHEKDCSVKESCPVFRYTGVLPMPKPRIGGFNG